MSFIVCEDAWPPIDKPKEGVKKKKPGPVAGAKAKLDSKKSQKVHRTEADLSAAIITKFNQLNNVKC